MRRVPLGLIVPLVLAACGGGGANQQAAGPDSVGIALEQYSPTLFDSISWPSDTTQTNRGAIVWTFSCKKCHGDTGLGDAHMVVDVQDSTGKMVKDTLMPPNFHSPGWRFATDKEGLIKYIYGGNEKQMPHWGISGLKPRDIDAVAGYIQKVLVTTPVDSTAAPPAQQ